MPDPPPIVSRPELADLAAHLRAAGAFAFDTEFVSEDTYEPVLGLIQVATRDRIAAIDPLAVGDLTPFWDALNDPAVEVVMHAAGEDLRIARMKTGRLPSRLFDVQIAAGFVGHSYPLSLNNLVNQVLGITLAGGETRTDWRRRPLSPGQVRYALDDVRHLLDVADAIRGRLAAMGRVDWVRQEMDEFVAAIRDRDDEERWRRLPGLNGLGRRALEVVRRLADWRLNEARRQDRPVRQVMRDDVLVAIAKRQPVNRRDLEALRDFNRPNLLAKADEIVGRIAEAQAVPPEDLPRPMERSDDGPGVTMVANLLAAALSHCCTRHKISVGLVGTTADLKDLVRWQAEGRPEGPRPSLVEGWRGEVCGTILLDVVSGRRALRVVDPRADVPIDLDET